MASKTMAQAAADLPDWMKLIRVRQTKLLSDQEWWSVTHVLQRMIEEAPVSKEDAIVAPEWGRRFVAEVYPYKHSQYGSEFIRCFDEEPGELGAFEIARAKAQAPRGFVEQSFPVSERNVPFLTRFLAEVETVSPGTFSYEVSGQQVLNTNAGDQLHANLAAPQPAGLNPADRNTSGPATNPNPPQSTHPSAIMATTNQQFQQPRSGGYPPQGGRQQQQQPRQQPPARDNQNRGTQGNGRAPEPSH